MEARIGELLQHKVGHVGTIDAQRTRWKRVGQDAVVAGEGAIHEPGRTDNGVIHIAGGEQTLLRGLVDEGMFEHRLLRDPEANDGERILILAVIRVDPRGAQHDEPVHVLLAHPLKNVGDGPGKHVSFFRLRAPSAERTARWPRTASTTAPKSNTSP